MRTFLFVSALCLAFSFFVENPAMAQESSNVNSIQPIIDHGVKFARRIEEQDPQSQILKLEFDLAHDDNYTTLDLEGGKTYVFGAFGDERIVELSMIIHKVDKRGNYQELYSKDIGSDNATVKMEMPEDSKYAIDVRIVELKDEHALGHFGLIVCEIVQ